MPPVLRPSLSPPWPPSDISRRSLIALAPPAVGGVLLAAAGRSPTPVSTGDLPDLPPVAGGAAGHPLVTGATVHPGAHVYPEA